MTIRNLVSTLQKEQITVLDLFNALELRHSRIKALFDVLGLVAYEDVPDETKASLNCLGEQLTEEAEKLSEALFVTHRFNAMPQEYAHVVDGENGQRLYWDKQDDEHRKFYVYNGAVAIPFTNEEADEWQVNNGLIE